MMLTRSLVLVLTVQLAAASYNKLLGKRVETLQDSMRFVEKSIFQVQDNLTRVLESLDKRLSQLEVITEQLQQRVIPEGFSLACPTGYVEVSGKCLYFSQSSENYDNATEECTQTGGQLAILDTCQLIHDIAKYIENTGLADSNTYGYWVGTTDRREEGKWQWSDGRDVQMGPTFWARQMHALYPNNEPNGGATENCLLMRTEYNFQFADSICNKKSGKSPFCQYDDDVCSSPRVQIEGRCVEFLSNVEVDWAGAGAKCSGKGGNLTMVDDCNFLGAVIGYILRAGATPTEGYWVGGNDLAEEGTWLWEDGTPVPMGTPYWGQDGRSEGILLEPNNYGSDEHCGNIRANVRWMLNDYSCSLSTNINAACEAPHIIVA